MERILHLPGVAPTANLDHIAAGCLSIGVRNPGGIRIAGTAHSQRPAVAAGMNQHARGA